MYRPDGRRDKRTHLCVCDVSMQSIRRIWIFEIRNFWRLTVIAVGYCVFLQNFAQIGQSVAELWPKRCFPIWRPSAILNLNIWILVNSNHSYHRQSLSDTMSAYQISKIGFFFHWDIGPYRHNDFHISGRPPSCFWDDVIIPHNTESANRLLWSQYCSKFSRWSVW